MTTLIGETLRTARERREMSLADAAERTCIRQRYLQALEAEDFETLGEDVYVRGFLRNYARALGLDPEPLLAAYRAEHEHPPADEAALTSRVLAGEPEGLPRPVRAVAAACTIVTVFALLAAVSQRGSTTTATPPAVTVPGPAEESVAEAEPTPSPEPTPTPLPAPADGVEVAGVEVELAIDDGASWLRVVVDGAIAFEGIRSQTTLTFAGDEEVHVRIGNAGAVTLLVNGEDHGTAGARGQVVEHIYRVEDAASA